LKPLEDVTGEVQTSEKISCKGFVDTRVEVENDNL
jgi:hypothetical protein